MNTQHSTATAAQTIDQALQRIGAHAVISSCQRYRYLLTRIWNINKPPAVWWMLNPSTADGRADDNTIRRCRRFTMRDNKAGGIVVVNWYAWRATDPSCLANTPACIGPENFDYIRYLIDRLKADSPIIAAWGAHAAAAWIEPRLSEVLPDDVQLQCLGTTGAGHPRHPLYVDSQTPLRDWSRRR